MLVLSRGLNLCYLDKVFNEILVAIINLFVVDVFDSYFALSFVAPLTISLKML